jgi:hypothetical protein
MFKWINKIKKGKQESQFDMEISKIINERNAAIERLEELSKKLPAK